MRYLRLEIYKVANLVSGRKAIQLCHACGSSGDFGSTELRVELTDVESIPDAVGVFFEPDWFASAKLQEILRFKASSSVRFEEVQLEDGTLFSYRQVILCETLSAGQESIVVPVQCTLCGGKCRLNLNPVFLKRPNTPGPLVAKLAESHHVILVREDLADLMLSSGLDIKFKPAYFEGEALPPAGPTFLDGTDWSDLASADEES